MVTQKSASELEDAQDVPVELAEKHAVEPAVAPKHGPMLFVSIGMMVAVLLLTGYFYWQNQQMDHQIAEIQAKTQEYQGKIDILKKDPIVRAGELFAGQKDAISKAITKSNAATYVREMDRLQRDFGFYFSGFTFAKDTINTSVAAQKGLDTDAIQKVIKFIASYRDTKKGESATASGQLFELNPIYSVSGDEEKRSISVQFTVK